MKSQNLKHVRILRMCYPDKTSVPLEDVLPYIPNVYKFIYGDCVITSDTMTKLFQSKRNVKFSYLYLYGEFDLLDPHLFNTYIKKMFDFDTPLLLDRRIVLNGSGGNVLEQLYELVKPWRQMANLSNDSKLLSIK
uniref:Uncharacterized protein n=1 Tax=Panagrolaimus sp. PS1159 TaxID=55785 RepID=A0AC35F256_9BILA